jgi:hypothetical protein
MPNELATLTEALPQKYSAEDFAAAASNNAFLPRLQLMTANSEVCKEGKFPINHYALIRDSSHQDLGVEVDVLVAAWRPKAMRIGDDNIVTSYDVQSADFKKIVEDSANVNSGCMYGPEYLVWVASAKSFATLYCGSKTNRRESGNIQTNIGKVVSLKAKKCQNSKNTWFGILASPSSVTPNPLPEQGKLVEEVQKFQNPPESDVQAADAKDTGRTH